MGWYNGVDTAEAKMEREMRAGDFNKVNGVYDEFSDSQKTEGVTGAVEGVLKLIGNIFAGIGRGIKKIFSK